MEKNETLNEFIEKNNKLITIVGVFGAIVVFSFNLDSYLMTFSALGIFLVLSWELFKNIPNADSNKDFQNFVFMPSIKVIEILFFGFVLAIYFYVGNYAFNKHPDIKILFIPIFIFIPIANFLGVITYDWLKGPELTELRKNKRGFRYWVISMIFLLPILCIEFSYLSIKFFEIVK